VAPGPRAGVCFKPQTSRPERSTTNNLHSPIGTKGYAHGGGAPTVAIIICSKIPAWLSLNLGLGALTTYKIPHAVDARTKEFWRDKCINGGPYTEAEKEGILDYCKTDVTSALPRLMEEMCSCIDLEQALDRGAYAVCCAEIQHRGLPVDADRLTILAGRWPEVRSAAAAISNTSMRFRLFGGLRHALDTAFSHERFAEYLRRVHVFEVWPRTASGQLARDDDTLKARTAMQGDLSYFRTARKTMNMRAPREIRCGADSRCHIDVRPFAAKTSRNQPKANSPIAYPSWVRALIRPIPDEGTALAILDYGQQEFGVAAALSQDQYMLAAYDVTNDKADPYLAFAIQIGVLPEGTVRGDPHVEAVRNVYKTASIAIMYGISAWQLSSLLGISIHAARSLLKRHQRLYCRYWAWSDGIANAAAFDGYLETRSGWRIDAKVQGDRTLRNFPIQATGGDILRRCCILARPRKIGIVALVHDAVIIEASASEIEGMATAMKDVMQAASQDVAGIRLRVDTQVVRPGQRYFKDNKARDWWNKIWRRLQVEP
jgi:DNA polymerase I